MGRKFFTAKNFYFVRLNEDGSLFISADGENSISDAGLFIASCGGIQKILERCEDGVITSEQYKMLKLQWIAEQQALKAEKAKLHVIKEQERMERRKQTEQKYKQRYEDLLASSGGVIPTTFENIGIVLRYLNTQNWGGWELPTMTIGYRCNQYDCDGKQASTMTLDEPIDIRDEEDMAEEGSMPNMVSKFQVGAPVRYLSGFHRC